MNRITDAEAAKLVLHLIPRLDFKGVELDAILALKHWASATINDAAEQPSLPGLAAE